MYNNEWSLEKLFKIWRNVKVKSYTESRIGREDDIIVGLVFHFYLFLFPLCPHLFESFSFLPDKEKG